MAITRYVVNTKNVWKLDRTGNYIDILHPVYFIVFLHSNFYSVDITKKSFFNPRYYNH